MTKKLQLIVPKHRLGILAGHARSAPQIGVLILASYVKQHNPDLDISVYDENTSPQTVDIESLNGDMIGISTWFSNYDNAISLAERIKKRNGNAKIVLGGPNVTGIERRILDNRQSIDYIITGDGEIPFRHLVEGMPVSNIAGLTYRDGKEVKMNSVGPGIDLTEVPVFDLSMLKTPYSWQEEDTPLMNAFPLSGLRGCFRKKRCAWCSIATKGVRTTPGNKFWEQVKTLRDRYGIDLYYESGDTLLPQFAKELAETKPVNMPEDVRLRAYSHVGFVTPDYVRDLRRAGFNNVFFGVESKLVQGIKYPESRMVKDFDLLKKEGITIMPGMILGMPGETEESLRANSSLLCRLLEDSSFVPSANLNTPYPFSGAEYFNMCLNNPTIRREYHKITGDDIGSTDNIQIPLLSRLFVNAFTQVGYSKVQDEVDRLLQKFPGRIAYWATDSC